LPGIAGNEILYNEDNDKVIGIRTGDMGISKNGILKDNFNAGIDIFAK
jgi:electron-transferring-flavoprotein dehydrogenase